MVRVVRAVLVLVCALSVSVWLGACGSGEEELEPLRPEADREAVERWTRLVVLIEESDAVAADAQAQLIAADPSYEPLGSLWMHWRADEALRLDFDSDMDREDLERYEVLTRLALELARDRGVLEGLLDTASYEGGLPPEDAKARRLAPGVAWSRSAHTLLVLAFLEAVREGDEEGAVRAAVALERMAGTMAGSLERYGMLSGYSALGVRLRFVFDSIELGLLSASAAEALLADMETGGTMDFELLRRAGARDPDVAENLIDIAKHYEFYDGAMRLVLAIRVFEGEHGALPETLDELVPGVLAALPENPYEQSGRYLYRRDPESSFGYVLYTPGPSGIDHGGVRSPGQSIGPSSVRSMTADYVIVPRERR
ncbi:MAG: hypothetical protein JJU33_12040 [Phycisphaerales bacterium]|nr:hypothetical protein [Phycisphaerales bacterium]